MAVNVVGRMKVRRGNTTERVAEVLQSGEPGYDETQEKFYIGDGVTPGGQGVVMDWELGTTQLSFTAGEALNAGDFVNIYDDSGEIKVRKADRSTPNGARSANGFVLSDVFSGDTVVMYLSGMNTALSGLTPNETYALNTNGDVITISTLPAIDGEIFQYLGLALSATHLLVQLQLPILRG